MLKDINSKYKTCVLHIISSKNGRVKLENEANAWKVGVGEGEIYDSVLVLLWFLW